MTQISGRIIRDALLHARDTSTILAGCEITDNTEDEPENYTHDDNVAIVTPEGDIYILMLDKVL